MMICWIWCCALLIDNGLFLNISKSMFGYRRVKYLGMIVDGEGVSPRPAKVLTGFEVAAPKRRCRVEAVLRDQSDISGNSSRVRKSCRASDHLVETRCALGLDGRATESFEDLRSFLQQEPIVLSFPHPGWPWVLDTDASGTQVAAVLQQTDPLGRTM